MYLAVVLLILLSIGICQTSHREVKVELNAKIVLIYVIAHDHKHSSFKNSLNLFSNQLYIIQSFHAASPSFSCIIMHSCNLLEVMFSVIDTEIIGFEIQYQSVIVNPNEMPLVIHFDMVAIVTGF